MLWSADSRVVGRCRSVRPTYSRVYGVSGRLIVTDSTASAHRYPSSATRPTAAAIAPCEVPRAGYALIETRRIAHSGGAASASIISAAGAPPNVRTSPEEPSNTSGGPAIPCIARSAASTPSRATMALAHAFNMEISPRLISFSA